MNRSLTSAITTIRRLFSSLRSNLSAPSLLASLLESGRSITFITSDSSTPRSFILLRACDSKWSGNSCFRAPGITCRNFGAKAEGPNNPRSSGCSLFDDIESTRYPRHVGQSNIQNTTGTSLCSLPAHGPTKISARSAGCSVPRRVKPCIGAGRFSRCRGTQMLSPSSTG